MSPIGHFCKQYADISEAVCGLRGGQTSLPPPSSSFLSFTVSGCAHFLLPRPLVSCLHSFLPAVPSFRLCFLLSFYPSFLPTFVPRFLPPSPPSSSQSVPPCFPVFFPSFLPSLLPPPCLPSLSPFLSSFLLSPLPSSHHSIFLVRPLARHCLPHANTGVYSH